jgi:hypothetical protein
LSSGQANHPILLMHNRVESGSFKILLFKYLFLKKMTLVLVKVTKMKLPGTYYFFELFWQKNVQAINNQAYRNKITERRALFCQCWIVRCMKILEECLIGNFFSTIEQRQTGLPGTKK